MSAKATAILLGSFLFLSGCSGKKAPTAGDEGEDGNATTDPDNPLPPALQYEPGYVDPQGKVIDAEAAAQACRSALNSTVRLDPAAMFTGEPHSHDLWGGATEKVIFDGVVHPGVGSWLNVPNAIVLPGAGRADFKLEWEQKPGDWDWRQLGVDLRSMHSISGSYVDFLFNYTKSGQVHSMNFTFADNDRPHAGYTDWSLRMPAYTAATSSVPPEHQTTAEVAVDQVLRATGERDAKLTWTIHRTYDCLPVDPPHYDLWDGANDLLVMSGNYSCTMPRGQDPLVSGDCNVPDEFYAGMVPPETGIVIVGLKWQNSQADPVRFGVEYYGSDQPTDKTTAVWTRSAPAVNEANHREYRIAVAPGQADSAYTNETGWRFRPFFDELGHDAIDDVGAFDGTLEWKVTAYRVGFEPS